MSQLLILIAFVAGPNLPFRSDRRGVCAELDGACGGDQSFKVLRCGGLHLVWCDLAVFVVCFFAC